MTQTDVHRQGIPLDRRADLNAFYQRGVTTCQLERRLYERLRGAMHDFRWVPDPEGSYNAIPEFILKAHEAMAQTPDFQSPEGSLEWDYDRKQTVDNFPDVFRGILQDILLSRHFEEWGFAYDFKVVFMDLWDGSEECPWHWDGTDDSDIILLAYVNDYPNWDPSWGGQLRVGERDLRPKGLFNDFKDVTEMAVIQPQRRTLALVNNRNPRLVHQPRPLTGAYERKVFTAGVRLLPKARFGASPFVTF